MKLTNVSIHFRMAWLEAFQGHSQDFSKEGGGHRGYSTDCHVDLHSVHILDKSC